MAEVGLKGPRVVALVGQSKHMRMSLEAEIGRFACTLHHLTVQCGGRLEA